MYFCPVNRVKIQIITRSKDLPKLPECSFFHSPMLFRTIEKTPGMMPYMVVAADEDGKPLAHMLAMLRRRGSWIPPFLFSQGRVYGEGHYEDTDHQEELFALMLEAITRQFHRRLCLYVEFSDISKKMFGYRSFRKNGYFPISWMEIHNSLHSKQPELRVDEKLLDQIHHAYEAGVDTHEARDENEIRGFYRILKSYYRFRWQRYVPDVQMFLQLKDFDDCKIYVTEYKNKIIGGSVIAFSKPNTYLWFEASRKKRYPLLRPHLVTVWNAIKSSYDLQKEHIFFLHVGLPLSRSKYRDFILRFGGKPVSTYRWFHFTFKWINQLLSWIYRE